MATLRGVGRNVLRAVAGWLTSAPPVAQSARETVMPRIPAYFTTPSWATRRAAYIASPSQSVGSGFAEANAAAIRNMVLANGYLARLHVVFNLGAGALLEYFRTGDYKNAYQMPVVNGKQRRPSKTRIRVDRLIGLSDPATTYFCALEMSGPGVRFYGEYCAVLKSPDDARRVSRVLDRNSYELICNPLKSYLEGFDERGRRGFIDGLGAAFRSRDCADLLAIRVMQTQNGHSRLLTSGTIGAAVIRDEDYVEAYHEGPIALPTVLELREGGEEKAIEASINGRWLAMQNVSVEEMLWLRRREAVRGAARKAGIPTTTVIASGRTQRWK